MRTRPMVRESACRSAVLTAACCLVLAPTQAQNNGPATDTAPQAQNQQTPANGTRQQLPQFEVASIKAHKQQSMMMRAGFRITPDGLSMSGVSLSMLISNAFGLPDDQILNEPGWANSDRYDIEAKVDPAEAPKLEKLTREQRMAMLLPLLEDRFGLKFHHETKVIEVYALVVDKGGPKLQPAKAEGNPGAMANEKPDGEGNSQAPPPANMNGNLASGGPDGGGKPDDGARR
jgi:hypothetical protein